MRVACQTRTTISDSSRQLKKRGKSAESSIDAAEKIVDAADAIRNSEMPASQFSRDLGA
jgi:hypothetical protein